MTLEELSQQLETCPQIILYSASLICFRIEKQQKMVRIFGLRYGTLDFLSYCVVVVAKWQMHQPSTIKRNDPRDFKKLNKMSLKEGKVTAKDQYNYRSTHDARIAFGII